jgi:zinc transport system ATP-binding protein
MHDTTSALTANGVRPSAFPRAGTVLEVEHLSVAFGTTRIFTDLNFSVSRGASLAIVGPNGAGKTALLKALIGAIPSTGAFHWTPGTRLGYVPQKLDIARDVPLTGLDFLRARASLARASPVAISDALGAVDLAPAAAELPIGALSGGQFQRLLVAFALVGAPDVLLLDEPTAGVDEPGQERLNALIRRLQQEQHLTVLLVSHDLTAVHRYATAVLCLGNDRSCYGAPREILTPALLRDVYGTDAAFHVHGH